jgi:hypothetical protein
MLVRLHNQNIKENSKTLIGVKNQTKGYRMYHAGVYANL